MLKWIVYLGMIVVLMAMITSPTEKEFKQYAYTEVDTTSCKPLIRYNSYKVLYFDLFSLNYVNQCSKDQAYNNFNRSQRYLGLFGTFWKL